MHICNYCGRVLKHDYEKCPGCGGSSFKNKAYLGEEIIKTPPKGGYKIDINDYVREIIKNLIIVFVATLFLTITIIKLLPLLILFICLAIIELAFLFGGLKFAIEEFIALKRLKRISKTGMLVKNIPYEVVETNIVTNIFAKEKKTFKRIKIIFKNSAGVRIPLVSELKSNIEDMMKIDDTVDLLIDPTDYSNFYIDFEIY